MANVASIPVEIARLIVQFASHSLSTSCSLSLVSRQVQTWSDPFLFCTMIISKTQEVSQKMRTFIDSFVSSVPSDRLCRARRYVQIVATLQFNDPDETLYRFLGCCSHLFSVCVWCHVVPSSFSALHIPTLRWLSLSGWEIPLSFASPVFQSISHLDLTGVFFSDWSDIWEANLAFIPNLSHLLLNASGPSDIVDGEVLSTISSHLTPSIRLVLLAVKKLPAEARAGGYDVRIAMVEVGILNVDEEVWTTFSSPLHERETIWSKAETLLLERRNEEA
ncbi:hypothetical protein DL96DRAFT_1607142 [Flagelloscypha sp. PMI_526]|nr:hypothetical protein DL96DRAFT_1607142 [Flagelloscypha sp. PMI_526]